MAVPQHPARNEYHHDFSDSLLGKTRAPLEEMPTTEFTSSNVHSGLYDFGQRELFLRYKRQTGGDAVYQYTNVPAKEWQGLKSAGSKGSYVNANIATAYNYAKVGRDELEEAARAMQQSTVKRFITTP